jgi:hypothetical protein
MKTLHPLKSTLYLILFAAVSMTLYNCAPVFSELQSARTVGKDRIEITPSYSTVSATEDGETEGLQNQLGLQLAYGLTDKIDIRARYERIWGKDGSLSDGVDVAGLAGKFSLVEDKIAFNALVGRAFGEESSETWEFQPSIIFSQALVKNKLEATIAPKYLMTFCEDCDNFLAFNIGLALGDDLNRWSIRPEYGMLFNPGESGFYGQFSLGFSVAFDAFKKPKK